MAKKPHRLDDPLLTRRKSTERHNTHQLRAAGGVATSNHNEVSKLPEAEPIMVDEPVVRTRTPPNSTCSGAAAPT